MNTSGGAFSASETGGQGKAPGQPNTLNLPKDSIANILQGNVANWNAVSDTTGAAVTAASQPIVIVNREQGSGSRYRDLNFLHGLTNAASSTATTIAESTGGTADFFSTGNVLAAANGIPGSITYASIDNAGSSSFPNLTLVNVNGVVPGQPIDGESASRLAPTATGSKPRVLPARISPRCRLTSRV